MNLNNQELKALRDQLTITNRKLAKNLNKFFEISNKIGQVKDKMGLPFFNPNREFEMLKEIENEDEGQIPLNLLKKIFKEIFKVSIEGMGITTRQTCKICQCFDSKHSIIDIKGIKIGGKKKILIGGPCSIENYDQLYLTAKKMKTLGVDILRGGAFKPRTSPYSFQGLEEEALKMLKTIANGLDFITISEVLDTKNVYLLEKYVDILQVGTRNMFNYSLLKELGKINTPVMIKRGLMATIEEFILAAEYIYIGGNTQIILCERGIRTFETQTRNTLDISAIPILKKETLLPVIVDISHSLGRKDIIKPIASAALSAGADGLMFESHYNPVIALSDSEQQLDLKESEDLIIYLSKYFNLSPNFANQLKSQD